MLSHNLFWPAGKPKEHVYHLCPAGPPLSLFSCHMVIWPTAHLCFLCRLGFRAVSLATLFLYAWVRSDRAAPFPPLPSSAGSLGCACLVLFICCSCDVDMKEQVLSTRHINSDTLKPHDGLTETLRNHKVVIGQYINPGRLESGYFEIIVLAD